MMPATVIPITLQIVASLLVIEGTLITGYEMF
jgi:hypothetical protein